MKRTRKILGEARAEDVVVVSASEPPQKPRRKRKVEVGLSLSMRREVLRQMAPQYQEASSAHKRVVLADFVRLTGYHRKYAMWLLNHPGHECPSPVRPPRRLYEAEVEEALVHIWNQTKRLCAKRLIPCLPMFVDAFVRHNHLHLLPTCRTRFPGVTRQPL